MSAGALLLGLAACSNSKPGSGAAGSSTVAAAKKADAPGSAVLASPEDNYVAAASEIACLGVESESADAYAKGRDGVLKAHGYTDASWVAAAKQLGKSKGDAEIGAMKCAP
jgi:hypothetical protein